MHVSRDAEYVILRSALYSRVKEILDTPSMLVEICLGIKIVITEEISAQYSDGKQA